MNPAVTIRLFSAAVPATLIAINSLFFPGNTTYWIFLLVVTMMFGYLHFFIGTVYQIKGILKNKNKNRLALYFVLLSLGALLSAVYLIQNNLGIILGICTIAYFVLHVFLNEYTFLNREVSFKVSYSFLISFLALFAPLFFVSLQHPAFFYDFKLTYPVLSSENMMTILNTSYSVSFLQALSIASVFGFTLLAPYLAFKQINVTTAAATFCLGLVATFVIVVGVPVNFVYMLHFVLVYHFVLLFLIFYLYFKHKNPPALRDYLNLHVVAVVFILVVYLVPLFIDGQNIALSIKDSIFNFGVFLTVSLMHISVSFLNEPWFLAGLKKYRLIKADTV